MQKKWKNRTASALFLIFMGIACSAQAADLKGVQQRYSQVRDFTVSFSQETFQVIANKTVHFTGTVSYKRSSGVRMDVAAPQKQILILRGQTALIILPDEGTSQVQDIPKEIAAQNILGFFSGLSSIDEYYKIQETDENLILKPKQGSGSIAVWVDKDNLVKRILLKDAAGNASDIFLSRYQFNQGLTDELFHPDVSKLTPPKKK
jgi:outer membrane lipoprotein-sorting protein